MYQNSQHCTPEFCRARPGAGRGVFRTRRRRARAVNVNQLTVTELASSESYRWSNVDAVPVATLTDAPEMTPLLVPSQTGTPRF